MLTRERDDVLIYWGRHDDAYIRQVPIVIVLKNGRQLRSLFNPYFRTITIGGVIFPERDLEIMTELIYNQKPSKIMPGV